MRDSEPKRAYYAEERLSHHAHVITNFRVRKFAGFCVIKRTENKAGRYPMDITLLCLACLEGLEPPTFWFVAKHSIRLS